MTSSSAFGENVDRLGSIRSILDNYPFSAGLLREILQNSDDAKASAQVRQPFMLSDNDAETHQLIDFPIGLSKTSI
jgi:sacsin